MTITTHTIHDQRPAPTTPRSGSTNALRDSLILGGRAIREAIRTPDSLFPTIFIPLSFFTGLYGMNFEYMPELGWKYRWNLGNLCYLYILGT